MKVTTGAVRSGMSSTLRPLASRVYSSKPQRVLTWVKPSTTAWAACRAAAETRRARNAWIRFMVNIGEEVLKLAYRRAAANRTKGPIAGTDGGPDANRASLRWNNPVDWATNSHAHPP